MSSYPEPAERGNAAQRFKLIFELTNLCNFSCVHCLRNEGGPKDFLSLALIQKVLREVQVYQAVDLVAFTGGEPTLHPQFAEIVRLVSGSGYPFGFVSNGWQFQKTFEKIKPYKDSIRSITFSIDGACEETHDRLRRKTGSFRRLMQAISLCKFQNVPFQINMVVTCANRVEIEQMARLAARLGCSALGYGHCQPTAAGIAAGLVLDAAARLQVEAEIAQLQKVYQLPIYLAGDHYSPAPFHQCPQLRMREFNIDYRGFLTACCMLSNYRGGRDDSDVIADLNRVSFYDAHQRLVAKIAQLNQEKIARLSDGPLDEADHFICTHCLEHYQKVTGIKSVLVPEAQQIKTGAVQAPPVAARKAVAR